MKNVIRIISIMLMMVLLSPNVGAIGLGVAPSSLTIHDALRGGEYERTITVFNVAEDMGNFAFIATGECKDWISFYSKDDPTTPIEKITIPGESNVKILVKFKIPDDITSGNYTSTIYVQSIPVEMEEVEGAGAATVVQMPVEAVIQVTGTQILTGIVNYLTARDTEINYPLRIQVTFQNTGNVIAKPEIKTIITKNGVFIDSFTHAETGVKPDAIDTISVEWDTTERQTGDYVANVTVSLGGDVLATKDLQFKLLPVGTLSRQGSLTDISSEGEPLVGKTLKILSTFVNTGEIDTKVKFIGEVYVDGDLIDTIESEELLVPVRETGTLTAYLKIEKDGSYTIKGHALYEGKTTDTKELSFDVGTEPESKPGIPGFGIIETIASTAVVIALIILFVRKRKRQ